MDDDDGRKRQGPTDFSTVLKYAGLEKPVDGGPDEKRHYAEQFSQDVAEWYAGYLRTDDRVGRLLPPEAPVATKRGNKRLDIGSLDDNDYLALDVSIKTFNFRDHRSGNYTKNYTGRFYELLGESFELHDSYPLAVLAALISLPMDSCYDSTPRRASSFGQAVRQFSKIGGRSSPNDEKTLFEFTFVSLHDEAGEIFFFDASRPPPQKGPPPLEDRLSTSQTIDILLDAVESRRSLREKSRLPENSPFVWLEDLSP
jgi:hypothetical protein